MRLYIMSYFDPLEQFSIEIYSSFCNVVVFSSFSSIGLMCLFIFLVILFCYYSLKSCFLLNKLEKGLLILFYFVISVLKDSLLIRKYSFILLFFSTFLFILVSNIVGMIPYSMTITSRKFIKLSFLMIIIVMISFL